jgi:hypothetical protein
MRRAFIQQFGDVFGELERFFNPPPPAPEPEPDVIVMSEDEWGTPRLGHRDFNARLMARPQSW